MSEIITALGAILDWFSGQPIVVQVVVSVAVLAVVNISFFGRSPAVHTAAMLPFTSLADRSSEAWRAGAGLDSAPAYSALHALVERFLELPIAVQILVLVIALPGGMTLVTALALALRAALARRRRREP